MTNSSNLTPQEKFDTCRFRSADTIQLGNASCCGVKLNTGYICFLRSIEGVLVDHCADCKMYDPRFTGDS